MTAQKRRAQQGRNTQRVAGGLRVCLDGSRTNRVNRPNECKSQASSQCYNPHRSTAMSHHHPPQNTNSMLLPQAQHHNHHHHHPPRLPMIRKRSLSRLKVELDVSQLHTFLTLHVCCRRSGDGNCIIAGAVATAAALQQNPSSRAALLDCASILTDFISTTTPASSDATRTDEYGLSPSTTSSSSSLIVWEAHSLVGCIQAKLQRFQLAAGSFLRALWIASIAKRQLPIQEEDVALTMHRLAKAYGSCSASNTNSNTNSYRRDAINLLETAILKYTAAGVWWEHPVVAEARKLLAHYQQQHGVQQRQVEARDGTFSVQTNSNSYYYSDVTNRTVRGVGPLRMSLHKRNKQHQQRRWTAFSKDPSLVGKPLAPLIEEETERRCSF